MRAGIYARYSSDNQNERSIEDQLRICREFIARRGDAIADIFADYEISGSSLKNRPQALRLIEAARDGRIDLIVAEDLDRLSRDQEDIAFIYKRCIFAGVPIFTLADGEINEMHIGLKGTMNAIELKKLADKTRRGQRGRVEAGFSAGGLGYGYRVVKELDARGELKRGLQAIDADEAAIVRRIFADYLAGKGTRQIAHELNREGVPAPFGRYWNPSTINGSASRGNGILCNALYAGKRIYNRVRMVKDPDTGKRLSRLNPPAQWITREVPELRIVPEEQWQAAQARKRSTKETKPAELYQHNRPKHLLSGLARCGCCGGAYVLRDRDRLGCARHHDNGVCDNGTRIPRRLLELRVLDGVKAHLLTPERIRRVVEIYHEERKRLAATAGDRRLRLEKRIEAITRDLKHGVAEIFAGNATKTLREGLAALEAEKDQLEAELAEIKASATEIVRLHPGVIEAYTRAIEDLRLDLDGDDMAQAIAKLRTLIERVEILPDEAAPEGFKITAYGRLAELLAAGSSRHLSPTRGRAAVAGERLSRRPPPEDLPMAC